MRFSTTLLYFSALISFSLALPMPSEPITSEHPSVESWVITNYTRGCSPGGCIVNFGVSSTKSSAVPFEPAFSTHCSIIGARAELQECENTTISAEEVLPTSGGVVLVIQHKFQRGEATYWIKGNATIDHPYPSRFTVPQTEAWAVL